MPRNYRFYKNEDLIREIEIRPAVWDLSCIQYFNRQLRDKEWNDIYQKLIPNWEHLSELEKKASKNALRTRWTTLRCGFKQGLVKSPEKEKQIKKKFPYTERMNFLLPNYLHNAMTCESFADGDERVETQTKSNNLATEKVCVIKEASESVMIKEEPVIKEEEFDISDIIPDSQLPVLIDKIKDEPCNSNCGMENTFEADRDFLMSLLPTFQNLSDTQKLQVKLTFLQTLKQKLMENSM